MAVLSPHSVHLSRPGAPGPMASATPSRQVASVPSVFLWPRLAVQLPVTILGAGRRNTGKHKRGSSSFS